MQNKNLNKLINQALLIEAEETKEAGSLGFMARALVQATLPHKKTDQNVFERRNGAFSMAMLAHPRIGLPYGAYPRLLLSWLTTEAVRTKSPHLDLGPTLSGFMGELGLLSTGGRWGSVGNLKEQMKRLFSCSVSCVYSGENQHEAGLGFHIAKEYQLWWDPKNPEQVGLWNSTVSLSRDFFDEIIDRPIPIDIRALKALKRSPLALDIYCWLTYRMSYLQRRTEIPWEALQAQFGSDYAPDIQGTRNFKKAFLRELKKIQLIYPKARIEEGLYGIVLFPSVPHISKRG